MDFDSSNKFISSLAKFLQSLCNGYVEFDNGVEVIGHIYLSVDTGKKIDYILNEKVCKTDQNSVTFISNSFHAQPAEKSQPAKPQKTDKEKPSDPGGLRGDNDEIMILDDGETKTLTLDSGSGSSHDQASTSPRSPKPSRPSNSKRSYSQSFAHSQSQRLSAKQSRTDSSLQSLNGANLDSDSLHSERSNSSSNLLVSQVQEPLNSSTSHLSTNAFLPTYSKNSNPDDSVTGDLKQEPENDLSLLHVKEEYDPGLEEAQEAYEESQAHGSYGGSYDVAFYSGGRRGHSQMADFSQSGAIGQDEMFQGAGEMGDTSDSLMLKNRCTICGKILSDSFHLMEHMNVHLQKFPYKCPHCCKGFAYKRSFKRHITNCRPISEGLWSW